MPIETNFMAYHRSIADELKATQDRIRNLIGSRHWQTDGEHKEAVLRKVLRTHLPEIYNVGTGFICYEHKASSQLDILITNRNHPTLFKDGELVFVTPDCVEAIIEVKTSLNSPQQVNNTLAKLADQAELVRQNKPGGCWVGLFVFRSSKRYEAEAETLLDSVHRATHAESIDTRIQRIIDCIALGPQLFCRFWDKGLTVRNNRIHGRVWHSYIFRRPAGTTDRLGRLAHAYFISNLVWALRPQATPTMRYAWFPLSMDEGKESFRYSFIGLEEGLVRRF